MAAEYTVKANEKISSLIADGYTRSDIFSKYVGKSILLIYPIIGEDGKPHLVKESFK